MRHVPLGQAVHRLPTWSGALGACFGSGKSDNCSLGDCGAALSVPRANSSSVQWITGWWSWWVIFNFEKVFQILKDFNVINCLKMLEQPEKLDEWKCEKCAKPMKAMKQLVPYRFPPILVIHLKVKSKLFSKKLKISPTKAFRVEHGEHALDEVLAPYQSPDRVRDFRRLSKHKSSIQIICCYYTSGKFFQFSPYLKFNYSSVFNHH